MIDPKVIVQKNVYKFVDTMPSGCYLTSIMNSIYNLVMLRYAAYECVNWSEDKLDQLRDRKFVAVTYGDDNIWSPPPNLR